MKNLVKRRGVIGGGLVGLGWLCRAGDSLGADWRLAGLLTVESRSGVDDMDTDGAVQNEQSEYAALFTAQAL